jgi:hypothetical protein
MSRHRDSKGGFIASKILEKIEQKTTRNPPHTNSSNLCARTILRGESSNEEIETIAKGTKYEVIVQIENILQQVRKEALVTQSEGRVGKETEVVVEEVASSIGETHKVLE